MPGIPTEQLAERLAESNERHTRAIDNLARKVEENHKEFALFRADVARDFGAVRTEMAGLRTEMVEGFGAVNASLVRLETRLDQSISVAKWTIGILVPVLLALIGTAFWLTWHAAKMDSRIERVESVVIRPHVSSEAPAPRPRP